MQTIMTPEEKIIKAKRSIMLSQSFYSSILLQLQFIEDNSKECPKIQTDGTKVYWNRSFVEKLNFWQVKGVLAQIAEHNALLHVWRMGGRNEKLWDKACDYAINPRLLAQDFQLPEGSLIADRFNGLSPEDIYRILKQEEDKSGGGGKQNKPQQQPQMGSGNSSKEKNKPEPKDKEDKSPKKEEEKDDYSKSKGKPENKDDKKDDSGKPDNKESKEDSGGENDSESEDDNGNNESEENSENQESDNSDPGENCGSMRKPTESRAEGEVKVQRSMAIAKSCGNMSLDQERIVEENLEPKFDWKEILHRFFSELTTADYSFSYPNRKYIQQGFILPSLKAKSMGRITLALDTSGSISPKEIEMMVAECFSCIESYCEHGITPELQVLYIDTKLHTQLLTPGEKPKVMGGGGTCFNELFEYLHNTSLESDALVFITDGHVYDICKPEHKPEFPVIWALLNENEGFKERVGFGEFMQYDINQT